MPHINDRAAHLAHFLLQLEQRKRLVKTVFQARV
jgi:hypothetical protein